MNIQSIKRRSTRGMLVGAALALSLGTSAQAALLLKFDQDPISPGLPELVLQNTASPRSLVAAPSAGGSQGNGDGSAAVTNPGAQTPGGLGLQVSVEIPLINGHLVSHYGGKVNTSVSGNSTSFYDTSLQLSNLQTDGNAVRTELVPAFGVPGDPGYIPAFAILSQRFTTGTFTLYTSYLDGITTPPDNREVILSGTINNMVLVAIEGHESASVQSTDVTYTGGVALQPWIDALGGTHGSLSWSLLSVSPFAALDGGTSGVLQHFQADLGGQFSAPQVPEPASLALLALSGLGLLGRFRKQKKH